MLAAVCMCWCACMQGVGEMVLYLHFARLGPQPSRRSQRWQLQQRQQHGSRRQTATGGSLGD